jgi:phosphatidylglycerophosphate synthase
MRVLVGRALPRADHAVQTLSPGELCRVLAQTPNLLSAIRFLLAAIWIAAFMAGHRSLGVLCPIAIVGAISDFVDGRVARWMHRADGFGRWLDGFADIAFVATALSCEAAAGAIPFYVPMLIVISFGQYTIDSVMISRSSTPVRSRLGHWSGVLNFSLVITLALAPPPQWPGVLIREASPLLAIFYLAAIAERALSYWRLPPINSVQTGRRDNAATVPSASLGASLTGLDGSDGPRSRARRRAVC